MRIATEGKGRALMAKAKQYNTAHGQSGEKHCAGYAKSGMESPCKGIAPNSQDTPCKEPYNKEPETTIRAMQALK